MTPKRPYCQITSTARDLWKVAQDLIDATEDLTYENLIPEAVKYRMLAKVQELQNTANELEKLEHQLSEQYWWKMQHQEDDLRAADWHDQQISERPPL